AEEAVAAHLTYVATGDLSPHAASASIYCQGASGAVATRCQAGTGCGGTQGRAPRQSLSVTMRMPSGESQMACGPFRQTLKRSTEATPRHRPRIGSGDSSKAAWPQ